MPQRKALAKLSVYHQVNKVVNQVPVPLPVAKRDRASILRLTSVHTFNVHAAGTVHSRHCVAFGHTGKESAEALGGKYHHHSPTPQHAARAKLNSLQRVFERLHLRSVDVRIHPESDWGFRVLSPWCNGEIITPNCYLEIASDVEHLAERTWVREEGESGEREAVETHGRKSSKRHSKT